MTIEIPTSGIIAVGDGRGFVVEDEREQRYVMTSAHCLPHLPPALSISYTHERTYQKLLGAIRGERTVWCECLFVDPVADIAVLGESDNQELYDEAEAYQALLEGVEPLPIGEPVWQEGKVHVLPDGQRFVSSYSAPASLLSLDGRWLGCTVGRIGRGARGIWIETVEEPIVGGMSGSPILADNQSAIGVVCASGNIAPHGPNPGLVYNLRGWLLRDLKREL